MYSLDLYIKDLEKISNVFKISTACTVDSI